MDKGARVPLACAVRHECCLQRAPACAGVGDNEWRLLYLRPRSTNHVAARNGHFQVLALIRASHSAWDEPGVRRAAAMGERSWACSSGLELTGAHVVVTRVARQLKKGEFVVLKWGRQAGCVWDEYTCSHAAVAGRLDMLRWARELLCPWGGNTWRQRS